LDFVVTVILAVLVALPFGSSSIELDDLVVALAFAARVISLARFGTTPGKALLDLEVVSIETNDRPTLTQAFIREATLFGPSFVPEWIGHRIGLDLGILGFIAAVITIGVLFYSTWRVPGKRSPWDRVSGTQVRYRASRRAVVALLP